MTSSQLYPQTLYELLHYTLEHIYLFIYYQQRHHGPDWISSYSDRSPADELLLQTFIFLDEPHSHTPAEITQAISTFLPDPAFAYAIIFIQTYIQIRTITE